MENPILNCILIISLSFCSFYEVQAQVYKKNNPLAHTYSIVARDTATGEMAAAVQSHWFSVGTIVIWGKSGVGVVATQSFVNPSYGPKGLTLMELGMDANMALQNLLKLDEGREVRQVAFLDVNGNTAVHTGDLCIQEAQDFNKKNYSVQSNLMLNDKVVPAMAEAYENNAHLPLAKRVMEALKAAQKAGGDLRGKQSAALIVVGPNKTENVWSDKLVDIRVDDHAEPIQELERLLNVQIAYDYMNRGDLAVEVNDMELALKEYAKAESLMPKNTEMKFWKAVTLANNGRLKEALPIFKVVFDASENWRLLTKRLPDSKLLTVSKSELESILAIQ